MADFCWRCLETELFPEAPERNDFFGLVEPGFLASVLCEGCGVIVVDHEGRPVTDLEHAPVVAELLSIPRSVARMRIATEWR